MEKQRASSIGKNNRSFFATLLRRGVGHKGLLWRVRLLGFITIISVIASCGIEEIGPAIQLTDDAIIDTTFIAAVDTPDEKVVLIEAFTGLACPNCPAGTIQIEQLMNDHPGRVINIAYVAGALANLDGLEKEDYTTDDGNAINDFLGPSIQWPSAAIDRTGNPLITGQNPWVSRVDARLLLTSPVNIDIQYSDSVDADTMIIIGDIRFTEAITDTYYVTIAVTESHIIDVQDSMTTIIPDYEHNHILRDIVTSTNGESLISPSGTYEAGRVFQKGFKLGIKPNWVKENLAIVVFVHKDATLKEILQAAEIEVD